MEFRSKKNRLCYVETLSLVQTGWDSHCLSLHKGNCILGQNFYVHNPNESVAIINILTIQTSNLHLENLHPITTLEYPTESSYVKDMLSPIFKERNNSQQIESSIYFIEKWLANNAESLKTKSSIYRENRKIDSRLIKVNRYLRENHEDQITLGQLAELIQCNPVYLSNTYSKIFKMSPIKHLQVMKMNKAMSLLQSNDGKIKDIAQRLGYFSASQFSEIFRRNIGLTPLEFRRNMRISDDK